MTPRRRVKPSQRTDGANVIAESGSCPAAEADAIELAARADPKLALALCGVWPGDEQMALRLSKFADPRYHR
ncbi:MAG: hypothetical protein ACKV2O_06390 [Acidimicrobiales bacterium]